MTKIKQLGALRGRDFSSFFPFLIFFSGNFDTTKNSISRCESKLLSSSPNFSAPSNQFCLPMPLFDSFLFNHTIHNTFDKINGNSANVGGCDVACESSENLFQFFVVEVKCRCLLAFASSGKQQQSHGPLVPCTKLQPCV